MTHPRQILSDRIHDSVPKLVEGWQAQNPDCLLPTSFITTQAAEEIGVSRAVVAKHLTEAVREQRLVEVLMYRDRRLALFGYDRLLPLLYAVEAGDVYEVTDTAPDVRGSNGVSFIATPEGFQEFMKLQRACFHHRG